MSADRKAYILDTSALIALFEDEEGADRVQSLLAHERVFIPFIALLETYYISYKKPARKPQMFVMPRLLMARPKYCG